MDWLAVVAGYLIGSVPTAYIAGRLLRGDDIRNTGDANVGAANAYRQLGARVGLTVFCIDAAKGALSIALARMVGGSQAFVMLAGVAAVAGHNWPVFLGFRGGRGEATTIGVMLSVLTLPMLILAIPTLAVLAIRKNVILASAVLFIPLPVVSWLLGASPTLIFYGIGLPCLVGLTHFLRTRPQVAPD